LTNSDTSERPLDHATARIVAELAAALLPRLQETLAGELKHAVESLSARMHHGVEETLTALERLKTASDEIVASLNAAEESMQGMSGMLSSLAKIREQLGVFAAQPAASAEALDALKNAISAWEGVLKADGHAQTRELSEFSSELSELIRDMGVNLPQTVKDTAEKVITSRNDEWVKTVLENKYIMEKRLARLEKIAVVSGAISAILLAMVALILYR
jgi:ABC-type transporter Mla subunit MlaD